MLLARRTLGQGDGTALMERKQAPTDLVPARDQPVLESQLGRPERKQRHAAEQAQLTATAAPARPNAAAREAIHRLPIRDAKHASARLRGLDHRLRHERPLARLQAARLEHPLGRLPPIHRPAPRKQPTTSSYTTIGPE